MRPIAVVTCLVAAAVSTTSALPHPQDSTPPAPTTFTSDIQTAILTLQGYIQNTIQAYAQNADQQTLTTAFTSTGRSLDFFLRNTFLPGGPTTCPQALAGEPLPPQASTNDEAIAYLQQAQLALIRVSLDAINNDFKQGIVDVCDTVRQYGGAARQY